MGPAVSITAREWRIIRGLIGGRRVKQLAAEMGISEPCISDSIGRLSYKLGIENLPGQNCRNLRAFLLARRRPVPQKPREELANV